MAPEKEAAGLFVENINIVSSKAPNQYHFQVTLVQQQLKRRYSKGYIELLFEGQEGSKSVKLKLSEVAELNKKIFSLVFSISRLLMVNLPYRLTLRLNAS